MSFPYAFPSKKVLEINSSLWLFAMSPNSASCERVFAMLKHMFGEQQMSALADMIQAALMLSYNDRVVG